jgi:hemerythrin-like domain-containing protein
MKSTKLLMADHELILRALHVLDEMVREGEHGQEINSADIHALLAFLRGFADGCHHVKEEAIFFPALIEAGMEFREGPLRVMGPSTNEGGRSRRQ